MNTQNAQNASKTVTAAIMIIGNEILSGRTQDINITFIAQRLGKRGIRVCEIRVVRDDQKDIVDALNALRARYTYVFTTGGIGPTHDDITADCIAAAFGIGIDVNAEAKARLETYYSSVGTALNEARLRMARIPFGARLIDNPVSHAPGFNIENVFVMAGVPKIMQAMFDHVDTMIEGGDVVLSRTVTCKLREGDLAFELGEIQKSYPEIDIGSYPGERLSLVLRGTDEARLEKAAQDVAQMIKAKGDTPDTV